MAAGSTVFISPVEFLPADNAEPLKQLHTSDSREDALIEFSGAKSNLQEDNIYTCQLGIYNFFYSDHIL